MRCEGPACRILTPSGANQVIDEGDCLCRAAVDWMNRRQREHHRACDGCAVEFPVVSMVTVAGPGGGALLCQWCYQGCWPLRRRRDRPWWDGEEWVMPVPGSVRRGA